MHSVICSGLGSLKYFVIIKFTKFGQLILGKIIEGKRREGKEEGGKRSPCSDFTI